MRFGFPSGQRLASLWRAHRPDVVHVATEGPLGWSAVATARAMGLPVTSSFQTNFDSYSQHYHLGLFKAAIEGYLRYLHNRTQATLVPTQAMLQALQARGYQNLGLMPRGVALAQFSPARRSEALRAHWGVGPQDLVVLHVGRLAREKNVDTLLAAFAALQQPHPGAKLVLVGDGPLRAALGARCPHAIFTGNRTGVDLAESYASSDLFLFPSLTVQVANLSSIWTVLYTQPACYNWLFQHYLRLEGLALSWVGTGRIIFSLNYTEQDFEAVADCFVRAAQRMAQDGWSSQRWISSCLKNSVMALNSFCGNAVRGNVNMGDDKRVTRESQNNDTSFYFAVFSKSEGRPVSNTGNQATASVPKIRQTARAILPPPHSAPACQTWRMRSKCSCQRVGTKPPSPSPPKK